MDHVRMDLLKGDKVKLFCAQTQLKPLSVSHDVFPAIPFLKAQIQDLSTFELAPPSGASAKTVDQPGQFAKGNQLQSLESLRSMKRPFCRKGGNGPTHTA